jgi:P-type conjugative transfer protein TrbJ
MGPQSSEAQFPGFPGGGGEVPVIDASNLQQNSGTRSNTAKIANDTAAIRKHTNRIMEIEEINIVPEPWHGADMVATQQLLAILSEVVAQGEALHYLLRRPTPGLRLTDLYQGYLQPIEAWPVAYAGRSRAALDILGGTLETVHEQLKEEQQKQDTGTFVHIADFVAEAKGNLQISQLSAMIQIASAMQLIKTKHLLGATLNAQNVIAAHHLAREARGESFLATSLMLAGAHTGLVSQYDPGARGSVTFFNAVGAGGGFQ